MRRYTDPFSCQTKLLLSLEPVNNCILFFNWGWGVQYDIKLLKSRRTIPIEGKLRHSYSWNIYNLYLNSVTSNRFTRTTRSTLQIRDTTSPTISSNIAAIAGLVMLGILVVVILSIIGVKLWRRKKEQGKWSKRWTLTTGQCYSS